MPILNPAPPWAARSDTLVLWHGCTGDDAQKIRNGIDPCAGRVAVDFGRGFYTTTVERQARHWAWLRYYDLLDRGLTKPPNQPVVLRFDVPRVAIASLNSLHFVGEQYDCLDFWSFVQHCRQSVDADPGKGVVEVVEHHSGPTLFKGGDWYDLVGGPVAAFWQQRAAMADADQFSFHTPAAVQVLNDLISFGGSKFRIVSV